MFRNHRLEAQVRTLFLGSKDKTETHLYTKGLLPPKVYYVEEFTGQDRDIFVSETEFRMKEVSRQRHLRFFRLLIVVVQSLSHVQLFATPWTAARQASPSFTLSNSCVCSNSWPSNQWCHPTISSFIIAFSCYVQSCPAVGFFPMSQLFTSGSQIIEASASVLPKNIQGWFPLGLTGLISLLSKGLSRVLGW